MRSISRVTPLGDSVDSTASSYILIELPGASDRLTSTKKIARDYIDQVFNQHNPGKAADFVTSDVVWHGNSLGDIAGAENLAGLLGSFIGALPDLYAAEQDITAENDLVMIRLVVTATVKGSLL